MQKNIETVKKKSKEQISKSSSPYQQNFEEIVSKLENKKLSKNYDPIQVFQIAKEFKKQLQEAQIISDKLNQQGMNQLEAEDLKCKSVGRRSAHSAVSRLFSQAMSNASSALMDKIKSQSIEYRCPFYELSMSAKLDKEIPKQQVPSSTDVQQRDIN